MSSLSFKTASKIAAAALLLGLAGGSQAAELVTGNFTPYLGGINGIESDGLTGSPYSQAFTAVPGGMLDKVVWWGYYLSGNSDASFEVFLGGSLTPVAGTLTMASAGNGITQYTLDVADAPLTAGAIAIWNKSEDVQWYWQAINNSAAAEPVAFSLQGSLVPEPGTWALMLGGVGLLAARRVKKQAGTACA